MSPALAGGFLTAAPRGKALRGCFKREEEEEEKGQEENMQQTLNILCKVWNIYYLALYRKSLPALILEYKNVITL